MTKMIGGNRPEWRPENMRKQSDLYKALIDSMMENGAGQKQPEKRPSLPLQSPSQYQHTTYSEAPESPDN